MACKTKGARNLRNEDETISKIKGTEYRKQEQKQYNDEWKWNEKINDEIAIKSDSKSRIRHLESQDAKPTIERNGGFA